MRRFATHALAFIVLQLAVLTMLWRVCPSDPNDYMASTIDKHARLEQAQGRRLIFVGGSSVAFGIDSREFAGLGLEPVNMGLSTGVGLPYMLAEVRPELREGDVVVVMPEPQLYWTGSQNDALWAVVERRLANIACVAGSGSDATKEGLDQALHFFARKVRCAAHGISTDRELGALYRRSGVNEVGDFVGHRGLPARENREIDGPWPEPGQLDMDRSIEHLQRFAARCERVGAHCFMGWSPVRTGRVMAERDVFEYLDARLRQDVPMPLLDAYDDHAFPQASFFDRGPHVLGDVATERSVRLRDALAEQLEASGLDG